MSETTRINIKAILADPEQREDLLARATRFICDLERPAPAPPSPERMSEEETLAALDGVWSGDHDAGKRLLAEIAALRAELEACRANNRNATRLMNEKDAEIVTMTHDARLRSDQLEYETNRVAPMHREIAALRAEVGRLTTAEAFADKCAKELGVEVERLRDLTVWGTSIPVGPTYDALDAEKARAEKYRTALEELANDATDHRGRRIARAALREGEKP